VELPGGGTDLVYSSADTYTLSDNVENLVGLTGSKTLIGNSLANSITANNDGEDNPRFCRSVGLNDGYADRRKWGRSFCPWK